MRNDKPSVRQLEYFIAVADCESFRAAAERLEITQPTITAQIAVLEKILDVRLFERTRAGTHLSPAGRELLGNARRVLEEVRGLTDAADAIHDRPGGTFRLGVTPTLGPYLLPHLLPQLHKKYPNLRLYVREDSPDGLDAGLADGRHDLILAPLPLNSPDFTVVPLFREPIRLVIASDHELAARRRIFAADLRGEGILAIEEHFRFFRQVEQLCQRMGARLLRDYQGTSLDALRHMVVMGMGHAFLPALYILSEVHEQSQLCVTDIDGEAIFRIHALAWRSATPARGFFQRLAVEARGIIGETLGDTVMTVE